MNATLLLDPETTPVSMAWESPVSDAQFEEMCLANDLFRLERTEEGEVLVHAPAYSDTSAGNAEIVYQLKAWWKLHRRGRIFDSSGGFFLSDGSVLNPDASYVSAETLKAHGKQPRPGFLRLCPDFVIELLSKTDRIRKAKAKMESWVENGAQLAWLVDPDKRLVVVYRPGVVPVVETGDAIHGSGPVDGFTLDLTEVWRCYEG